MQIYSPAASALESEESRGVPESTDMHPQLETPGGSWKDDIVAWHVLAAWCAGVAEER